MKNDKIKERKKTPHVMQGGNLAAKERPSLSIHQNNLAINASSTLLPDPDLFNQFPNNAQKFILNQTEKVLERQHQLKKYQSIREVIALVSVTILSLISLGATFYLIYLGAYKWSCVSLFITLLAPILSTSQPFLLSLGRFIESFSKKNK